MAPIHYILIQKINRTMTERFRATTSLKSSKTPQDWILALKAFHPSWAQEKLQPTQDYKAWVRTGNLYNHCKSLDQLNWGYKLKETAPSFFLRWAHEQYSKQSIITAQEWIVLKMKEWLRSEDNLDALSFMEQDASMVEIKKMNAPLQDPLWIQGHQLFLPEVTRDIFNKINDPELSKNLKEIKKTAWMEEKQSVQKIFKTIQPCSWEDWLLINESVVIPMTSSSVLLKSKKSDAFKNKNLEKEWENFKKEHESDGQKNPSLTQWMNDIEQWNLTTKQPKEPSSEWTEASDIHRAIFTENHDLFPIWLEMMKVVWIDFCFDQNKTYPGLMSINESEGSPQWKQWIRTLLAEGTQSHWFSQSMDIPELMKRSIETHDHLSQKRLYAVAPYKNIKKIKQTNIISDFQAWKKAPVASKAAFEKYASEITLNKNQHDIAASIQDPQKQFHELYDMILFNQWFKAKIETMEQEEAFEFSNWASSFIESHWIKEQEKLEQESTDKKINGEEELKELNVHEEKNIPAKTSHASKVKSLKQIPEAQTFPCNFKDIIDSWFDYKIKSQKTAVQVQWITTKTLHEYNQWLHEKGDVYEHLMKSIQSIETQWNDGIQRLKNHGINPQVIVNKAKQWWDREIDSNFSQYQKPSSVLEALNQMSLKFNEALESWVLTQIDQIKEKDGMVHSDKESLKNMKELIKRASTSLLKGDAFNNVLVSDMDKAKALKTGLSQHYGFSDVIWKMIIKNPKMFNEMMQTQPELKINWGSLIEKEHVRTKATQNQKNNPKAIWEDSLSQLKIHPFAYENQLHPWIKIIQQKNTDPKKAMMVLKELLNLGLLNMERPVEQCMIPEKMDSESLIKNIKEAPIQTKQKDKALKEQWSSYRWNQEKITEIQKEDMKHENVLGSLIEECVLDMENSKNYAASKQGIAYIKDIQDQWKNNRHEGEFVSSVFWSLFPDHGSAKKTIHDWHNQWVALMNLESLEKKTLWTWQDPLTRNQWVQGIENALTKYMTEKEKSIQQWDLCNPKQETQDRKSIENDFEKVKKETKESMPPEFEKFLHHSAMPEEVLDHKSQHFQTIQNQPTFILHDESSLLNSSCEIRPLNDEWSLFLEGKKMNHCIGSTHFAQSAKDGDWVHYHMNVTTNKGLEESTLTFSIKPYVTLIQHHGYSNQKVSSCSEKWAQNLRNLIQQNLLIENKVKKQYEEVENELNGKRMTPDILKAKPAPKSKIKSKIKSKL